MAKAKKLPSGNYRIQVGYTDVSGSYCRKSFTAETAKKAQALASQFLFSYKEEEKPENKTLGQLCDIFIENRSNVLSPSTIAGYEKIRRTAFQTVIDWKVSRITAEAYQAAVNAYASDHSPKSVFNAHAFFNRVLKNNHVHVGDEVLLPQKEKKEVRIPSVEEVNRLLSHTAGTPLYVRICFSVFLGLRRSELSALKWKDIDWENRTFSISRALVKDEFGQYVEKATKTYSSTRVLHIPTALLQALPPKGEPETYIINESIEALDSQYKRACVKADFPYNFHALRHFFASVMLETGMPNRYAKERMGHSTENMLIQVYQHTFADM